MSASFWLDSDRQGFTNTCIFRFGMSFDGGPIQQPLQEPKQPKGRTPQTAYPGTHDARRQKGHSGNRTARGRGNNTQASTRAMQRPERLLD